MLTCMGYKGNDAVSSPLLPTEEAIAETLTSSLPFDLIPEILCRLPVKLLLQLRCICKSWYSLISNPNFVKMHLRHSTTHLVHVLTYSNHFLNSYTIDSVLTDQTALVSHLKFSNHIGVCFVGSCNGILCFLVKDDAKFSIIQLWNPSIRKFKLFPLFGKPSTFKMYGFGHDPVTDRYKVVVVFDLFHSSGNLVTKFDVKVYTLGANLWKKIPKLEFPFVLMPLQRSGIYVSGTINWLVKDHLLFKDCTRKNHFFVVSLDLRNESYQEILLPVPDYGKVGSEYTLHLSVFRDCLCMISRQDVWIMKEYGNTESWTKLLTISYMQDPRTSWVFANAMHIFEDGQVFVKAAGGGIGKLVVYNSRNDSFELPFPSENTLGICVESLISP